MGIKYALFTRLQDDGWEMDGPWGTRDAAEELCVRRINGPLGDSCMYEIRDNEGELRWDNTGCFALAGKPRTSTTKNDEERDLHCVAECFGDVQSIEVLRRDDGSHSVYHDNDLDDGVDTDADILDRYGPAFWNTLKEYKTTPGYSLAEWLAHGKKVPMGGEVKTDDVSITLYYREGTSDKVYQASVEPKGKGYVVTFAYGRRGGTLNTGTKTPRPVPRADALKIYDKLVNEKKAKGYKPEEHAAPSQKKAKREDELSCVVEVEGELRHLSVTYYEGKYDEPQVYLSGDLDDSTNTNEELLDAYGDLFWEDLASYYAGNPGYRLDAWISCGKRVLNGEADEE